MPLLAESVSSENGVVDPIDSDVPPKYAFPVVVAPPLIVRPVSAVPFPMVDDAYAVNPPVSAGTCVS